MTRVKTPNSTKTRHRPEPGPGLTFELIRGNETGPK